MKNALRAGRSNIVALLLAGAFAGCGGSSSSYSPATAPVDSQMARQPAFKAATDAWSRSMVRRSLPSAGCFEASYPGLAWTRIACSAPVRAALTRPPVVRSGNVDPAAIGDEHDYSISVSPRHISTAIGSFAEVVGVRAVKTVPVASQGGGCNCGDDSYSLQMNSQFFATGACGKNAHCVGWEQLLYFNPYPTHGKTASLFTQDWLVSTSSTGLTCPPTSSGWHSWGPDCYRSSPFLHVPKTSIVRLADLGLSLSAAPSGDSGFLFAGTKVYGMKDTQGDFMELSKHWTTAEFNVVGDAGGSLAIFNPGSTITVRVEAEDGSTARPSCLGSGTTAETNSLSFIAAPSSAPQEQYPSILFTESNVAGTGHASCDAVAAH